MGLVGPRPGIGQIAQHFAIHNPVRTRSSMARLRESGDFTPAQQALVDAADLRISLRDGIIRTGAEHYVRVGLEAVELIEDSLAGSTPETILDMGCGYGRVLRFLRARFPEAEIVACDIDRRAVDFCASTFGASPLYSRESWQELRLTTQFDLIWSGSLVTHLDDTSIVSLLTFFRQHLAPGGVMVFTSHGTTVRDRLIEDPAMYWFDEIDPGLIDRFAAGEPGYTNYPRTSGQYGFSLTPRAWLVETIARIGGLQPPRVYEAGWDNHQDVVSSRRLDVPAPVSGVELA